MKRLAVWVGIGTALVAVLILAAVLAVPYALDLPQVQALAAASASQVLGRPVRFTSVSLRVLPMPRVELYGLEVAEDPRFGTEPFIVLERGILSVRLRPLLGGRLEFGELTLERPLIRLVEGPDGRLNVASLGDVKQTATASQPGARGREMPPRGPAAGTSLLAADIAIEKGTAIFASRAAQAGGYRVVDLDLRLRGMGPALTVVGRGILDPGRVSLRLAGGEVAIAGARSLAEAPLRGQLHFESDDVGPLVATLVPAGLVLTARMGGALHLEGVLVSPRAAGSVAMSRATIRHASARCRPPERALAVEDVMLTARWAERTLVARPVGARAAGGAVAASATLTIDHGLRATVSDISVRGVSLAPVLGDFLCHGYAVTGPLDLSASVTARTPDVLRSASGEGRFSIGRGHVVGPRALDLFRHVARTVDLVASVAGEERPSPFEFDSIAGSYQIRDGVVTTRDLLYTGRGFTVSGSGHYGLASDELSADLVFRHRREQVRARVTGTAEAPVLKVDVLGATRDLEGRVAERGLRDLLRHFR